MLVLKRLADARHDGDRVLAVLRGTAVNHDGKASRFTLPSGQAQEDVCRAALRRAGVEAAAVGMIEAHGTGTRAGDLVELASLASVYGKGDGRCALGSVRTNVGHAEAAAGMVGLLKAVLAVQHGEVPAQLHFHELPREVEPSVGRLFVPTESTAWPVEAGPRIAAACSYGFGGTNAHAIVEQARAVLREVPALRDAAAPHVPAVGAVARRARGHRGATCRLADRARSRDAARRRRPHPGAAPQPRRGAPGGAGELLGGAGPAAAGACRGRGAPRGRLRLRPRRRWRRARLGLRRPRLAVGGHGQGPRRAGCRCRPRRRRDRRARHGGGGVLAARAAAVRRGRDARGQGPAADLHRAGRAGDRAARSRRGASSRRRAVGGRGRGRVRGGRARAWRRGEGHLPPVTSLRGASRGGHRRDGLGRAERG